MTMFFAVADKTQLDAVEIGNQVEFQFVKDNGGTPLITQIKSVEQWVQSRQTVYRISKAGETPTVFSVE